MKKSRIHLIIRDLDALKNLMGGGHGKRRKPTDPTRPTDPPGYPPHYVP